MNKTESPRQQALDWLKKSFLELVSVFIAIMLALWVDEWHEEKQRKEKIELAMSSVETELQKNYRSLVVAHKHQTGSLELIHSFHKDNKSINEELAESLHRQLYKRSMFHPSQLLDTAWQVLIRSQLMNYMDHQTILLYSTHYNYQKELMESQKSHGQSMTLAAIQNDSYISLMKIYAESINNLWWRELHTFNSFRNLPSQFFKDELKKHNALKQQQEKSKIVE